MCPAIPSMASFMADHAASYVRVKTADLGAARDVLLDVGLDAMRHDGETGSELRLPGSDPAFVGELLGRRGVLLHELTLVRSSLEDAFMELTADSVEYAAGDREEVAA